MPPPPDPAAATAARQRATAVRALTAEDEEDRLPHQPIQWLGLLLAAAAVGAAAGLIGALFRLTLFWADVGRLAVINFAHAHCPAAIGWLLPVVVCGLCGALGLWLTQRFAPYTAGSGIPRVEAVLRAHLPPAGGFILPVKFIGGALSIGCGMALGREGPTVQMGGTVGRFVGDLLKRTLAEPWTLIAAGAGAGLAVAFNAPLAAALFVMEELLHRFSSRIFSATLVACITGTLVLRALLGNATDFNVPSLGSVPADVLPIYLLLGLAAGLLGVAFNLGILSTLRLFDGARLWPKGAKGALVGAAVGLLAFFDPRAVGGGELLSGIAIQQNFAVRALLTLLFLRFVLTMASYGCGAPGGIFAPILALGALLGNACANAAGQLNHTPVHPAPYAIVAMSALMTAVVRSPLTGVVLLLEMTGGWTLILPMMAASFTAFIVPELFGVPPIYDSLRQRDEAIEHRADPPPEIK
jgi:CIC family chloride channel protein